MIDELIKQIEDSYYWDARVKALDCNYFGDEVKLIFEDEKKDIVFYFTGCYQVKIDHVYEYPKEIPSKELKITQIPYFMQDVEVNEIIVKDNMYYGFEINIYPIQVHIVCKNFNILCE